MIVFNLQCRKGHGFEGWFKSGADFDRQAKRGLVECPSCGSTKVAKALSAPRLAGTRKSRKAAVPAEAPATQAAMATDPAAAKLAELQFAEEARKIHYEEAPARGIYGEASPDDVKSLKEEGIEFYPLPVLPEDQN